MHHRIALVCSVALIIALADLARAQPSQPDTSSSQIRKQWILGQHLAQDLEQRDGAITDPELLGYLQRTANRVAPGNPLKIRLTRGSDEYASLLPHGVLYISGNLLEHIANEAELAGLIAHQTAHASSTAVATVRSQGVNLRLPACVLASPLGPIRWSELMHDAELHATTAAVTSLKVAGYEPSAVLDLLSRLAYEHPIWSKAIRPEDLLSLRVAIENDDPPTQGYRIDSSEFIRQHALLLAALGHAPKHR